MAVDNEFALLHAYRRLVRRGLVEPLKCGSCGEEYVMMLSEDDTPRMECFGCGAEWSPGKAFFERLKKVIQSYQ